MEREAFKGAKRWLNRAIFPASAGAVSAEIGYVLAAVFNLDSYLGIVGGVLGFIGAPGIQFWKPPRGSENRLRLRRQATPRRPPMPGAKATLSRSGLPS